VGAEIEQVVLAFVAAAHGERMDVDAMMALVADDFVYQLNVPRSAVIRGREAARAEFERHVAMATGMIAGSEIRMVVSNDETVVMERFDVNDIGGGTRLTFHVASIFEVRDGLIAGWREYWDTGDVALQMGLDAPQILPSAPD
jgi:limonene-1,2-epoxide hydrolase